MIIGLTGRSGFIGTQVFSLLQNHQVKTIDLKTRDWKLLGDLKDIDVIIHLAGVSRSSDKSKKLFQANTLLTKIIAEESIKHQVKRFVFVSSIQAVAKTTDGNTSVKIDSFPSPCGDYGRSKQQAEDLLRTMSIKSGLEVVIIRPPLVYGPGVKANFQSLLSLVFRQIPLPLSALEINRRSYVSITNLVDLIQLCLKHPLAANQTFHVSDDDDISTAELLQRMGKALGKPIRNLPVPKIILKAGLKMAGKGEWVDKLFGDLRVDISETKRLLGWKPKVTMEEELERTAGWWRESRQGRL